MPKHPAAVGWDVLSAILLRFALTHKPAVVRRRGKPASALETPVRRLFSPFVSSPIMLETISMLEDHRRVKVVLAGFQCARRDQIVEGVASRAVSLIHVFRGRGYSPIGLIRLK